MANPYASKKKSPFPEPESPDTCTVYTQPGYKPVKVAASSPASHSQEKIQFTELQTEGLSVSNKNHY